MKQELISRKQTFWRTWLCHSLGLGLASGYWERSKVRTLLMTQSPCCGHRQTKVTH